MVSELSCISFSVVTSLKKFYAAYLTFVSISKNNILFTSKSTLKCYEALSVCVKLTQGKKRLESVYNIVMSVEHGTLTCPSNLHIKVKKSFK